MKDHSGDTPPAGAPPTSGAVAFDAPPGPTPTTAVLSLVLGIASIALCLGLLAGIPAMVLGRRATRQIQASRGVLGGGGVATAGFVTGLIGTILSVLVVVALIGVVNLGNSIQDRLQDRLQDGFQGTLEGSCPTLDTSDGCR